MFFGIVNYLVIYYYFFIFVCNYVQIYIDDVVFMKDCSQCECFKVWFVDYEYFNVKEVNY